MKAPTTLTLAMLPLLISAHEPKSWLFETTSGRAQGIGSHHCQKFYMKKTENWTLKFEAVKKGLLKARSASPEPQVWGENPPSAPNGGSWGNAPAQNGGGWGNTPIQGEGGTWIPTPEPNAWAPTSQPPPSYNGGGSPPWTPPPQQNQPARQPPPQNPNSGTWTGPTAPPSNNRPPPSEKGEKPTRCCVRMYLDESCKDTYDEGCVTDKNDGKGDKDKGKAGKDAKSFNVLCTK